MSFGFGCLHCHYSILFFSQVFILGLPCAPVLICLVLLGHLDPCLMKREAVVVTIVLNLSIPWSFHCSLPSNNGKRSSKTSSPNQFILSSVNSFAERLFGTIRWDGDYLSILVIYRRFLFQLKIDSICENHF